MQLVDTARYPVDDLNSAAGQALLRDTQTQLAEDGCAVLSGFVSDTQVPLLVAEADAQASHGHRSFNRTNVYFTQDDPTLPATHPIRQFYDRSNAFVPADNFGPDSLLRQLYEWSPFRTFIQQALQQDEFYPYADPLADVIVNLAEEGNGFPWHFDTNNFTVTLCLQNAESGGEFEYCPRLRTATDENYEDVASVLDGKCERVKALALRPGDLQIFKGRYALHRVTPLRGTRPRYVAIFSFVEEPGMVGSPERTRQLYGRVLPIHLERAGQRADNLID